MIFAEIADTVGVSQTTLLAGAVAVSIVARAVGALIPDNATGWQAIVRKLAKVIGLAVSNRVEKGVSVTDVARASLTIADVAKVARGLREL